MDDLETRRASVFSPILNGLRFVLSPQGRLGRACLWIYIGYLTAALLVLRAMGTSRPPSWRPLPDVAAWGLLYLLALLALTMPMIRRFHDFGWPGGLALALLYLPPILTMLPVLLVLLTDDFAGSDDGSRIGSVFLSASLAYLLMPLSLLGLLWAALTPSQRGSNRYGPHLEAFA